ncbi:MAG TPA: HBL/NHE enterotoxin family protein [Actinocrinis sp.]|nr:HBL/NHE enterotoxin family protein [Actinocrinis sp.]
MTTKSRFFPFQLARDDTAAAVAFMRPGRDVEAAPGAEAEVTPIDQQLADSFNANNAVLAYVLALTGSTLPTISPVPTWYQSFVNSFSEAKTHAMLWQNTVTPGLIAIPTGILNFAPLWSLHTSTISQAIAVLDHNPQNPEAKQAIRSSLASLHSAVTLQKNTATDFQKKIDDFADHLTTDAQKMQAAIGDATKQAGYNRDQVQQLTRSVNALNDEIAKWQTVVTAAAIAAGVSFWVGAVIAIFTFGAGLAFGIVGAVTGIALLIAAEVKIKQLSAQILQDQAKMNDLNLQIAALTVLGQNLNTLVSLSSQAGKQVKLILAAWQELEKQLAQVIADIDGAKGNLDPLNLPLLERDMVSANSDWQALQKFCAVLAGIQYNQAAPPSVVLPTAPKLVTV